jgi:hypothetical protein
VQDVIRMVFLQNNVEKFGTRRAAINGDADEALQFD